MSQNELPNYENEIVQISVAQEKQGKDIVKNLILYLEAILKNLKIKQYYLQVFIKNERAIEFYKKNNFLEIAKFSDSNGEKLLMKKNIKDN